MKFCDRYCKYAKLPRTAIVPSCHTVALIWCNKKQCHVEKNARCDEKDYETPKTFHI